MAAPVEIEVQVGPDLVAAQNTAAVGADKRFVVLRNGKWRVKLPLNINLRQRIHPVDGQPVLILYGRNPNPMTNRAAKCREIIIEKRRFEFNGANGTRSHNINYPL
jgi:hypothetical protein